jgi:type VI protein secretion system component VasA
VDERAFSGASPWLFGSVLERLFARLVSINSFTEFTLKVSSAARLATGHREWVKGADMSDVATHRCACIA